MKKRLYIIIALTTLNFAITNALKALEIPLGKAEGKSTTVGYVDMELIFQEFPETKKAKQEYYAEVETRRKMLAGQEEDIAKLNQRLLVLKTTLESLVISTSAAAEAGVESSTEAAGGEEAAPEAGKSEIEKSSATATKPELEKLEKEPDEKKEALETTKQKAVKELEELEESRSLQILGRIYNILEELAQEEGISMVVDKSSILYGSEAVDLTHKLKNRLRGR